MRELSIKMVVMVDTVSSIAAVDFSFKNMNSSFQKQCLISFVVNEKVNIHQVFLFSS